MNFKIFKQFLVLSLLISSLLFAYQSERYLFQFDELSNWTFHSDKNQKELFFVHPEGIATINITAFLFREEITANALQEKRMGSHYDGWVNRHSRAATTDEMYSANVEDAYRALYSKHILQDDLSLKEFIVAEFYFVKNLYGYIISLETSKQDFKSVNQDLQFILNSFWVGLKRDVSLLEKKSDTENIFYEWNMIGQNSMNQGVNEVDISFQNFLGIDWTFDLPVSSNAKIGSVLVQNDLFYFYLNDSLYAYEIKTGKQIWTFKVPNLNKDALLVTDHILVYANEDPNELVAILANSGMVLYKIPFQKNLSVPILNNGDIVVNTSDSLYLVNLFSGEIIEKVKINNLSVDTYPVASKNLVVVLSKDKSVLYQIDLSINKLVNTFNLDYKVAFTPSIVNNSLFIAYQAFENDTQIACLESRNLNTLDKLFEIRKENMLYSTHNPPCFYQDEGFLFLNSSIHNNQYVLSKFLISSGVQSWQQNIEIENPSEIFKTTVSNVILKANDLFSFYVFDILTGQSFISSLKPNQNQIINNNGVLESRYLLYKKHLLFIKRQSNTVSFIALK